MMKRILVLLILVSALGFGLFADGPMGGLFDAADQVAGDVPRVLEGRGDLLLGAVVLDGVPVQLGDLFADLTANRLTSRRDFNAGVVKQYTSPQYPVAQAAWILSGTLYEAGAGHLLIIQLLDSDGIQLKGWEFALDSDSIESMLEASILATAGGMWDQFEPNDERSTAAFPDLPLNVDGLTLDAGDEDWFAVEVPQTFGSSVLILDAATTGMMDTYMELYAPDDLDWPRAENDDTDGSNAVIQMPLTEEGTWYLKVRGYSSEDEGEYGLRISLDEGSLGPGEPDEGQDLATRLNVGSSPLEKTIDYTSDTDWFRIVLVRPLGMDEVLRIETSSSMDLVMELTDEYGGYILDDDDSGYENNPMIMAGNLAPGTYYATVHGYAGDTGDYEIYANITVPVRDEYESDDSLTSASTISPDGRSQRRSFSPMGDEDWVRFNVTREAYYRMETAGDIDTYMELYDEGGDLVDENDDDVDYNAAIERRLSPGTWYLRVSPYGAASPDDIYELSVEPRN